VGGISEAVTPKMPARPSVFNVDAIHFRKANTMAERRVHLTTEAAELLAVDALSFLAGEPEALGRFLALTGIGPGVLREAAADPGFLMGVLDYFLSDEPLLIAYARHAGIPEHELAVARRALGRNEGAP